MKREEHKKKAEGLLEKLRETAEQDTVDHLDFKELSSAPRMIVDNVEDAEITLEDVGTSIEQLKDLRRRLCIGHGKLLVENMRNLYNSFGGFSAYGYENNVKPIEDFVERNELKLKDIGASREEFSKVGGNTAQYGYTFIS